jgi:predicted helicase
VMGNPPYSVSSNNKSKWIQNLIADYKVGLNERKINLDDDYIKFIRFAEYMIEKNGSGIVGMITNNSYIDGITHRQMRKHLLETFDKIYVLDLHGSAMKREIAPDGGKDENIFDIKQGVSIVLMIKTNNSYKKHDEILYGQLWGLRNNKFEALNTNQLVYSNTETDSPYYFFKPKDNSGQSDYESGISINDLFMVKASGFRSGHDQAQVRFDKEDVVEVVSDLIHLSEHDFRGKYQLKDGRNHNYIGMRNDVGGLVDDARIIETLYRPFLVVSWPGHETRL